jgi:hypothetical protein
MQPPMGHSGPASPPTGNAGLAADAMSKMREAIKLIEMALPQLPTGSEAHKSTIDALGKLSKAFPATEEVPGVQQTQLRALGDQAQKSAMMQAVMRMLAGGAGGGAGGPTGGTTPPQAAAAAG